MLQKGQIYEFSYEADRDEGVRHVISTIRRLILITNVMVLANSTPIEYVTLEWYSSDANNGDHIYDTFNIHYGVTHKKDNLYSTMRKCYTYGRNINTKELKLLDGEEYENTKAEIMSLLFPEVTANDPVI